MRFAAALLVLAATPALAQTLPQWAAPSHRPAAETAAEAPLSMDDAPPPPPPIPVDGGLALLALSGAALAARKLRPAR